MRKANFLLHECPIWCVVGCDSGIANKPFSSYAQLVAAKPFLLPIRFSVAQKDLRWQQPFGFQTADPSKLPSREAGMSNNRDLNMPNHH